MWDVAQYERYEDYRSRPFYDLTGRIGAKRPDHVVDLGCGTGALTASLGERWPEARIEGVDSSSAMLAKAESYAIPDRVAFTSGDLATWHPSEPVDVLVSNAAFQWVPDHVDLLPRFVDWLAPGGWFAFSVPGNFRAPSHRILAELRMSPRWRDQVGEGADRHLSVLDPEGYVAALASLGCVVDAWETTYAHVLTGDDAVLEWVKGTGLRPVLDALDEPDRAEFLAEYGARLNEAYPPREWGTVFPFRRIFVVAHRSE